MSLEIKCIRPDQKLVGLARQVSPILRCFLSRLINLISKDTNMVFSIYKKNTSIHPNATPKDADATTSCRVCRNVARRKPGGTGFKILSAVLRFNGNTYKTSNFAFIVSLLNECQLLKKRICFSWSKFFPLREDPISKKAFLSRKVMKKTQNLFPFVKMGERADFIIYSDLP